MRGNASRLGRASDRAARPAGDQGAYLGPPQAGRGFHNGRFRRRDRPGRPPDARPAAGLSRQGRVSTAPPASRGEAVRSPWLPSPCPAGRRRASEWVSGWVHRNRRLHRPKRFGRPWLPSHIPAGQAPGRQVGCRGQAAPKSSASPAEAVAAALGSPPPCPAGRRRASEWYQGSVGTKMVPSARRRILRNPLTL